jgi:two-component system, NtrC family, response regulator HydG
MPAPKITPAIFRAGSGGRALLRQARRYAAVDATVLITGETGVGKDALARYIHAAGPRRRDPFVIVDCPALPSTLVEAELFGHERGAFTDATTARPGRFEMAGRGTLYLDAVTGLNPSAQGALLRIVEERRVTRLGGTLTADVKARIIASAEGSIEDAVRDGTFRAELYHRLRVLPMQVPPLRERADEILPLARGFLAELAISMRRIVPSLTRDAEEALARYQWPGNVRELRHVLERVLLAGTADTIAAKDLPPDVLDGGEAYLAPTGGGRPTLEEVERRYITLTLQIAKGNQTRAAAILGISRKALWEKRKRYGLR